MRERIPPCCELRSAGRGVLDSSWEYRARCLGTVSATAGPPVDRDSANLVGVLPLATGSAVLLWAVSSHYRAAPQGWEISPTPDYLLSAGPYLYSRNPMYVGEAAIWAGWALLYGSLPVAAGLVALVVVQNGAVRSGGAHAPQSVG